MTEGSVRKVRNSNERDAVKNLQTWTPRKRMKQRKQQVSRHLTDKKYVQIIKEQQQQKALPWCLHNCVSVAHAINVNTSYSHHLSPSSGQYLKIFPSGGTRSASMYHLLLLLYLVRDFFFLNCVMFFWRSNLSPFISIFVSAAAACIHLIAKQQRHLHSTFNYCIPSGMHCY